MKTSPRHPTWKHIAAVIEPYETETIMEGLMQEVILGLLGDPERIDKRLNTTGKAILEQLVDQTSEKR